MTRYINKKNMTTYPNQKIIHINKDEHMKAYLSINKDEWIEASNNLKPITFKIYLYLASNANGFDLALSRQDIMDKLNVSKNSYHNGIAELEEKNYIVFKQGNIYDFYTTPMYQYSDTSENGISHFDGTVCTSTVEYNVPSQCDIMSQPDGTEISKISKINNLSNKVADAPASTMLPKEEKEKKRFLKDLSIEELKELKKEFEQEVKYVDLYKKYNLAKNQLDKTLGSKIDDILSKRDKEERNKEIKEQLDQETKQELMSLMNIEEKDLIRYLTAFKPVATPKEIIAFLKYHEIFTYKEWIENYAEYKEYNYNNYFEWFVGGVNENFNDRKWEGLAV